MAWSCCPRSPSALIVCRQFSCVWHSVEFLRGSISPVAIADPGCSHSRGIPRGRKPLHGQTARLEFPARLLHRRSAWRRGVHLGSGSRASGLGTFAKNQTHLHHRAGGCHRARRATYHKPAQTRRAIGGLTRRHWALGSARTVLGGVSPFEVLSHPHLRPLAASTALECMFPLEMAHRLRHFFVEALALIHQRG
jgi:hypothetical protein